MPPLGEGIEKAVVACWHCREGQRVQKDDDIVELVTDKASFNVPAGCEGTIKKFLVKEGEEARIGDSLVLIEG